MTFIVGKCRVSAAPVICGRIYRTWLLIRWSRVRGVERRGADRKIEITVIKSLDDWYNGSVCVCVCVCVLFLLFCF